MAINPSSRENVPMTESPIGARLERERLKRGESQDEAADRIGVSQPTYSRWTLGQSFPKSAYWVKIGRYLGVPRDEVGRIVNEERSADPADARMNQLEARFDRLEGKVDRVLEGLDLAALPKRRRAR